MTGLASDLDWRSARCRSRSGAEAELAHPSDVVLYPEPVGQLPAPHAEDVDLIDILEAPAGRRMTHPFPQVGPGAAEMRGHFVVVGDQADDLHLEVGEGVAEGRDPVPCHCGELTFGYLVQHVRVAGIDRLLNQALDQLLVLAGSELLRSGVAL